ncbi:MAG: hypothetical protein EZS28_027935 [Streblomastix strix]|uniref:Uncharacterized protein n=1 Tax=Streblomastix strix TaxID=222440 RepID=A0A5J4V1D0_9EUKA|nr:MAG: hypothetical protein EZS28_027935 [Streblomastix strix]
MVDRINWQQTVKEAQKHLDILKQREKLEEQEMERDNEEDYGFRERDQFNEEQDDEEDGFTMISGISKLGLSLGRLEMSDANVDQPNQSS